MLTLKDYTQYNFQCTYNVVPQLSRHFQDFVFNSVTVVGSSRPIVSGNNNKDSVTITFIAANIAAGPQDIYSA
jgi:hypothetical protein